MGLLRRYLFERKRGNVGAFACVLDSDPADLSFSINIQESVLVEVASLGDIHFPELDMQRIGILEVLNLHGLKDLSKNALWTVSPSDKSITRKCFPPISGIFAHRLMRPSAWTISLVGWSIVRRIQSNSITKRSGRFRISSKYRVNFTG
jgi:hypothetical protein